MSDNSDIATTMPADRIFERGQAMQQIKTSYATAVAVQRPRLLAHVEQRFLAEAERAGEDFYYGWGSGKNRVEGASVGLAMCLARNWGNCAIETPPVQDLPDAWIFTACFVDLETGFTSSRQFRQSKKWTVHGQMDAERKDDVRFQIGQSKAIRNVILNVMPEWLIELGRSAALNGARSKLDAYIESKGLPAAVDLVIKGLVKAGVKEPDLLRRFGLADRNALTVDHVLGMRADLNAITKGNERADDLYPTEASESAKKPLAEKIKPKPASKQPDPPAQPPQGEPPPNTKADGELIDDGMGPSPPAPAPLSDAEKAAIEQADAAPFNADTASKEALIDAIRPHVERMKWKESKAISFTGIGKRELAACTEAELRSVYRAISKQPTPEAKP